MSIGVAVFIFGAILLFIALVGGGFEAKELKVPQVNQIVRIIATGTWALFIVTGIALEMRSPDGRVENPPATPGTTLPPTTTPPRAFPTAQESELLIHVPRDFRATHTSHSFSSCAG